MNKFFNICYKVVMWILVILFFIITVVSAFYGIDQKLSPIVVILGTILVFFLFKWIYKKIDKISDKKIKLIAIIIGLIVQKLSFKI